MFCRDSSFVARIGFCKSFDITFYLKFKSTIPRFRIKS